MRLAELESREDAFGILCQTLADGWSKQLGREIAVSPLPVAGGQRWLVQGLLSVLCTPDVTPRARRFVADSFRYTRVRWRAAPQLILGTALATRVALRQAQRAFWVTPPIPRAEDIVVVPGNRRVRTFDFSRGVTRAFSKAGFARDGLAREINVRGSGRTGPFVALTGYDLDAGWIEEPIVPGLPLSRWPVWRAWEPVERAAIQALAHWTSPTAIERSAPSYAAELRKWIGRMLERIERVPESAEIASLANRLAASAGVLDRVELAESHGDFQPGNIHVASGREVLLCDWEYSGMRTTAYDLLTYHLRLRSSVGLAQRAASFLDGHGGLMLADVGDRSRRLALLALVLLEDVARALDDAAGAPFRDGLWSLRMLLREIRLLPFGRTP